MNELSDPDEIPNLALNVAIAGATISYAEISGRGDPPGGLEEAEHGSIAEGGETNILTRHDRDGA